MTSSTTTLSIDEQTEIVARHYPMAVNALAQFIPDISTVRELSMARLDGGRHLYGDTMFHKTRDELVSEALEEVADALVYLAVAIWLEKEEVSAIQEDMQPVSDTDQHQDTDTHHSHS
jgi:hypothetical protein